MANQLKKRSERSVRLLQVKNDVKLDIGSMYQCVDQWSWDGFADAGMWMHQAQELVGETCTVGGILLYSDKTSILNNQMCYPVYSK